MTRSVLVFLFQAGIYTILAPGVVGLLRWLKARLQARRGADIRQPYRDLFKLLRKTPNIPEPASWLFSTAPLIIFVCYLLLGLFLPTLYLVGDPTDIVMHWQELGMDFLFIVYLLGLAKFVSGLAAFDVAASFGNMSSGRQFFVHLLAEPALFVAIYALALTQHSSNVVRLLETTIDARLGEALLDPAMVLVWLALGTVLLAESGRLPFDNSGTHLELTMIEQGIHLGYTGRALALIEWAQAMKLTFFLSLLAGLAWPTGMATSMTVPNLATALLIYLAKIGFLIVLLALWEITQVKLRLRKIVHPLITAVGLALIAVVYGVVARYLSGG